MKRKLIWILIVEAMACVAFCILGQTFENAFTSIMAFPFEQIGRGLCMLSTAGIIENAVALILYFVFCLAPVTYFCVRALKRKVHMEDWLLVLMSIVLFAVVYMMINPADIVRHVLGLYAGLPELANVGKAFLGAVVYSIVVGYLILRILRKYKDSETASVFKHLKKLLAVVCIVLTFSIFYTNLTGFIASFGKLNVSNHDPMQDFFSSYMLPSITRSDLNLGLNYIFLVLQYLVTILPSILGIVIVFSGLNLIAALEENPYGEAVVVSARKTGQVCRYSVIVIMLSQIGINILQFALGPLIQSSRYALIIPLLSIVFMLAPCCWQNILNRPGNSNTIMTCLYRGRRQWQ